MFLRAGGTYTATPLYDVLSAYPWVGEVVSQIPVQKLKMAMAVRGKNPHYHWNQIHRQHWDAEAKRHGFGASADPIIEDLLDRTPGVLKEVEGALPPDFPGPVAQSILGGLASAAERLGQMKEL